ncbi:hypothetical protein [Methylocella sp.]|uniref:hypothetical protein n=1 Tax=Methylocella sp. TaxID=1978226 RepID=UPI0035AFFC57
MTNPYYGRPSGASDGIATANAVDNKAPASRVTKRRLRSDLPKAWHCVWVAWAADVRAYASPFVTHCAHHGIEPYQVDQCVFLRYADHVLAGKSGSDAVRIRGKLNAACTKWNKAAADLALAILQPLPNRRDADRRRRETLPVAVRQTLAAFEAHARATCASQTAVQKVNRLHDLLVIARTNGLQIDTFDDLKNPDLLDALTLVPEFGPIEKISARRNRIFGEIETLFRDVLRDQDGAVRIHEQRKLFAKITLALPESRVDELVKFDAPQVMSKLIAVCDGALANFERAPGRRNAAAAQAAIGILLINNLALSRADLLTSSFRGPIKSNHPVARPSLMARVAGEIDDLDLALADAVINRIDRYWWIARQSGLPINFLFSKSDGTRKSGSALSTSVAVLVAQAVDPDYRRLGRNDAARRRTNALNLSPAGLRDLAVKRMMDEIGLRSDGVGDAALKDLLGYTETQNFTLRYAVLRERVVACAIQEKAREARHGA